MLSKNLKGVGLRNRHRLSAWSSVWVQEPEATDEGLQLPLKISLVHHLLPDVSYCCIIQQL